MGTLLGGLHGLALLHKLSGYDSEIVQLAFKSE